jgi:hypothetical protein
MSIEKRRSLLRISKEKFLNSTKPSIIDKYQKEISEVENKKEDTKRIKTTIKSKNQGKNLNPDYTGKYKGESFIIAGCGSSINSYRDFSDHYVIGVNDIERILTPDFLVVVNEIGTFMRGRWQYVDKTLSPVIFSHLDNPGPIERSENIVNIKLGERDSLNLDDLTKVDFTTNSPYMAAIIAYQMGASKIGIVGVDFTNHHFFSDTGTHRLSKNIVSIDSQYMKLRIELEKRGVKVANLSSISALEAWPKMDLETFNKL